MAAESSRRQYSFASRHTGMHIKSNYEQFSCTNPTEPFLLLQDEGAPGDNGNAAAKILEEQYWYDCLCGVECCLYQNTECNMLSDVRLLRRRIVERASQEEVTVDYANDLDTKRYESACWTV